MIFRRYFRLGRFVAARSSVLGCRPRNGERTRARCLRRVEAARRQALPGLILYLAFAGIAFAQATRPADSQRRPRVLIIGDSISIGYTRPVIALLRDEADVSRIPGNAAHTWNGLEKLDAWLAAGTWDVIHFNWGLHDLKHLKGDQLDLAGKRVSTAQEYEANLTKLVTRLRATGARLIWASTTPIPHGAAGRIQGQEIEFNDIARKVMDAHGVTVNDLHACVLPHLAEYQQPRNVHFTAAGSDFLARKVARSIRGMLRNARPPFDMPEVQPPVFPDRTIDIRDHGAVADGKTLNTRAIAAAIDACAAAGGGRVLVPAGVWLTGAIHLKSNINLHLAEGAELRFSTNPEDYLPAVFVRWGGFECFNYSPLLYANNCENVAVTGKGTLEGQGRPWWTWVQEQDRVAQKLYRMVLDGVPPQDRRFGNPHDPLRPQFFQPIRCRNVLVEGVTITAGPFWTIQAVYCENVLIRGVTILNDGPNNDGMNLDSSRNAVIEHCVFETGDDSIALKSGLNEDGWRVGRPTENVVVRHCRMRRGHGGVVIGSEMSGDVRNVFVHDCDFSGSLMGLRVKSSRGRGGIVEHIWCQDITLGDILDTGILLHTDYKAWFGSGQGKAPRFRDIHISHVTGRRADTAVRISGLPEQAIEDVSLEDVALGGKRGLVCNEARGITLTDVAVVPATGPALLFRNARDCVLRRCLCRPDFASCVHIEGEKSRGIRLDAMPSATSRPVVTFGNGASRGAVVRE